MLLVRKPEGKRPLGTPRRRWVDNIKIDLLEIGWVGGDWASSTNEGKGNTYRLLGKNQRERDPKEDQGVVGWLAQFVCEQ
jgi:hypothetical protein